MFSATTIEKFWKRVNKSEGCWEWSGNLDAYGYGSFRCDGIRRRAHRMSWEIAHGQCPRPWALHKCDNRRCVRPSHLFEGDQKDNMADAAEKNRLQSGDKHWTHRMTNKVVIGVNHGQAKLTDKDVVAIRQLRATTDMSLVALGKMFGVHRETLRAMLKGLTWRHVA